MRIRRHVATALVCCAVLAASAARAANDTINEDARKHFNAGVSLLQDPDGARYEDAYREFEAAYTASSSPKVLGNIGYCALKLERDGEAISAYSRYLQEVKDVDPAEAAQIARDVATLRAGLVRVTVNVDTPDATVVDRRIPVRGEPITNLYGPATGKLEMGIRPGHHVIEVKVNGQPSQSWEFDAQPSATLTRSFSMKVSPVKVAPEPSPHKSSAHVLGWVVTAVGAATLATGGAFGLITLNKAQAISNSCPGGVCPSSYALGSAQDDVHRYVRITDALLIGGGVVAGAGLMLVLWPDSSEGRGAAPVGATARVTRPVLTCAPTGCLAAVSGAF
jgi:hypothetical protein